MSQLRMGVAFVETFWVFFLYPIPFCPSYSHKFATNTRLQTARTNRFSQNNHPALQLDFSGSRCLSGDLRSSLCAARLPTSGISALIFQVHAEAFRYRLYQYWCRIAGAGGQPIPQLSV